MKLQWPLFIWPYKQYKWFVLKKGYFKMSFINNYKKYLFDYLYTSDICFSYYFFRFCDNKGVFKEEST